MVCKVILVEGVQKAKWFQWHLLERVHSSLPLEKNNNPNGTILSKVNL